MGFFSRTDKDYIKVPANRLVQGHVIRKNVKGPWQKVESVGRMESGLYKIKANGHLYLNIKPTEMYHVRAGGK